jgi:hypothetical protein
VSFAAITLCVASQRMFIIIIVVVVVVIIIIIIIIIIAVVYFVIDSVRKVLDTSSCSILFSFRIGKSQWYSTRPLAG